MRLAPLVLAALAGIRPLEAQNPPRVQTDSNRARTVATDTTRNRRIANQDSARTDAAGDTTPGDRSSLGGIRLRSIGPGMISGRITDLAVHPRDKKTWYIGVAAGGVWKTTNAGTTWTPVFDQQSTYSVGTVVIDPKNPNVVWVGTGENNAQRAVAYGDGVYKSVDAGRTWQNVGLKESEHIGKILIDPRNSDIVYVAAQGPLSVKGGDRGLYKTTDGGRTWKKVLDAGTWAGVSDVVLDPRNPDVLLATTWQRIRRTYGYVAGGPESGVWRSTDGGGTWRRSQTGMPADELGRIGLAVSPVNPDVVYAMFEAGREGSPAATGGRGGFYRSRDAGTSWERMSSYNTTGLYYSELFPDPVNVDRVYVVDVRNMVTEDAGRTFRAVGERDKHVDNHVIWIDPDDIDHLLIGCDGGLYETFDRGQTYKFFANLPLGQFYRVDVDNSAPFYRVFGGTQDNGSVGGASRTRAASGISNSDWAVTGGGDGFVTKVDPKDSSIIYVESQHGAMQRVNLKTGESVSIVPQPEPGEAGLRWYWDSPLIISPHANTRLYFAAQRLYRSDDRGNSWKPVSADLSREIDRNRIKLMDRVWSVDAIAKNSSSSFFGAIVAIAESPVKENQLWIGTDDGAIQVSENGGASWRKIDAFPGIPDTTQVARVVPSSHDANTVYAAFDGHMMGDYKPYLLKSTDLGRTWRSIAGNLPARGSVYAVVDDPKDPNMLYVGTEFGLWFTRNGGQQWTRLRGGLPTIQVRDLVVQKRDDDLVLATFGRGFYVLDDLGALRAATPAALAADGALFPVRRTALYVPSSVFAGGVAGWLGSGFFQTPNPPFGATFTYSLRADLRTRRAQRQVAERATARRGGDVFYPSWDSLRAEDREEAPAIILTVTDAEGTVIRRLAGPTSAGIQRVSWDLRHAAPTAPRPATPADDEEGGPRGGGGALVSPGTYIVSLAKRVDGVTTPVGQPQKFEVYMLDGGQSTRTPAIVAFRDQAAKLQRAMTGASSLADELSTRTQALLRAVEDAPGAGQKLSADVREIDRALRDIRETLNGDPTMSRRQEPTSPSLIGRLNVLTQATRSFDAPTATQQHQYELVAAEYTKVQTRLRAIVESDLKRVEAAAEAAGVPWTSGRIPEWRP
jgi:photosystem II stability/assembly factor-like uncharacterized protein